MIHNYSPIPMTEPKQQRSIRTQQKLLSALDRLLQQHYFEQISVAQLAAEAEVSVGTFYRRFKDKEALLPLLYQQFSERLQQWSSQLTEVQYVDIEQALKQLCLQTHAFVEQQRHVLRTVHLNSRIHSQPLPSSTLQQRQHEYRYLAQWLASHLPHADRQRKQQQLQLTVFLVVNGCIEKGLYPQLTPAIAVELEGEAFCQQMSKLLLPALQSDN